MLEVVGPDFAKALRQQVESDLRRRSHGYERVVASVVWLLDNSLIRVGNPAYARQNKSFGLTTLRNRHVEITGSTLRLNFKGKSGNEWRLQLTDRRIAKLLRNLQDMPGQHLFRNESDAGRCAISSRDVNTAQTRTINAVIDLVAAKLGNTRAVCRRSYIHPAVPEAWQKGELRRSERLAGIEGLDEDEVETA